MHCRPGRHKAQFKTGLHRDTGYPVQTPILYLKLTFLNKKGTSYFILNIYLSSFNSRVGTGKPVLPNQLLIYLTLIFDN